MNEVSLDSPWIGSSVMELVYCSHSKVFALICVFGLRFESWFVLDCVMTVRLLSVPCALGMFVGMCLRWESFGLTVLFLLELSVRFGLV